MSNRLLIAAVLLVGIGIGLGTGYGVWQADNNLYEQALVIRVIDGDTVELADGRRVRYLGIDTPESGEYYAENAIARNAELVEGKTLDKQLSE